MNHLRIGVYTVDEGTPSALRDIATAPGEIVDILRAQDGFEAYTVVEIDAKTVVSITVWESHAEAEAATEIIAAWVEKTIASMVTLNTNYVGDALFWAGVAS